jgi:hypothetical protein
MFQETGPWRTIKPCRYSELASTLKRHPLESTFTIAKARENSALHVLYIPPPRETIGSGTLLKAQEKGPNVPGGEPFRKSTTHHR